jgi:drug/metabolite transporter (DMT)-like permease
MLWSTGFFFGKIALEELKVGHMVFYRFLFGCFGLVPFALRHPPRFNGREWRTLLTASFLGIPLQFLIQFHGLAQTTVAHAALMVGAAPVLLAAAATIFAGERLDAWGWLALIGSTAGVMLVVMGAKAGREGAGATVYGDFLILIALVISTWWILANKQLMEDHPPVIVTTYGLLSGFAMLSAIVFVTEGAPPLKGISRDVWLALAASGFFCTTATTLLWNWGLRRVPASRAGVFLNIEPVLGSALGVKFMGDHLGPWAWAGGGLLVAAALTVTTRPHSAVAEIILD